MSFKTRLIEASITQTDIDKALIQMRDSRTSYSGITLYSALQDCMISRVVDEDVICNSVSYIVKPRVVFGFLGLSGRACKSRLLEKAMHRQLLPSDLQKELGLAQTIYILQTPFETYDQPMMMKLEAFVRLVRDHELRFNQPWKEAVYA